MPEPRSWLKAAGRWKEVNGVFLLTLRGARMRGPGALWLGATRDAESYTFAGAAEFGLILLGASSEASNLGPLINFFCSV